ncbi:MAG: amidohydrolase family protein [Candidatus Cloacimonetes bacterium]|nr:amidohydrolase family protein [Candidatus Cloacimonadota bacterium]
MEFSNLLVVKNWKNNGLGKICLTDALISEKSDDNIIIDCKGLIAYPSLINIHDHLVGNWIPKGAPNRPYKNTSIWVEDMKKSESVLERSNFWKSSIDDLTKNNGIAMAMLGVYKNIFSGVTIVQDHIPNQKNAYYKAFPIKVISDYRQGHSITLKNWWGGGELEEEMKMTKGKIPFIIHLSEGIDEVAKSEFSELEKLGLLKNNSILVHCTALTKTELKKVNDIGASIAWCPNSNIFLLDTTLDFKTVFDLNINLCIGTDSTLSGSINILKELIYTKQTFTQIPFSMLFKMVTENPAKALILDNYNGRIEINRDANLLITKKLKENPYENLLNIDTPDIELLLYRGKPIFGKADFLKYFTWNPKDFYLFELNSQKMFVIGHPEDILNKIEKKLGYKKHFDYLPF